MVRMARALTSGFLFCESCHGRYWWIEIRNKASAHLHEGVNSQNCEIRLSLGVVNDVKVHQLLQLDVVGLHSNVNSAAT